MPYNNPYRTWQVSGIATNPSVVYSLSLPNANWPSGMGNMRNFCTDLSLANTNSSTYVVVNILDGSTPLWGMPIPPSVPNNSGLGTLPYVQDFTSPLRGTPNTSMGLQLSASGYVYYSVGGYVG